jgi:hypothetical protein
VLLVLLLLCGIGVGGVVSIVGVGGGVVGGVIVDLTKQPFVLI